MGQYTKLLQVNPSELTALTREELYNRFYTNDAGTGDNLIDLDKSLPGIQFLLTGSVNVDNAYLNLLVGEVLLPLEDERTGLIYRMLTPGETRKVDQLISAVEDSDLQKTYDPLVMLASNIYPNIWDNGKESYDYLYTNFLGLKNFISKAKLDSKAVIVMTT